MKQFLQDYDAFFEPADALGIFDTHDFVLERLRGALLVGTAETNGEPRASAGNDIEARPLLREQRRMAMRERRHATDREFHFLGYNRECGQQCDRFQARLSQ